MSLPPRPAELIAVTRNWAKSYVLWALATDQNHGPFVGGCETCRVWSPSTSPTRKGDREARTRLYVLGQASKFLLARRVSHRLG